MIRAFDKNDLELLVEHNGNQSGRGYNVYQDYLIWGDVEIVKVYQIKAWIETIVPFKLTP